MKEQNESAKPKTDDVPSASGEMSGSEKAALEKKIAEQQEEQLTRHLDKLGATESKPNWLSRLIRWVKGGEQRE